MSNQGADADRPTPDGMARLLEVMARLRDPARGCPWDLEQTFASIAPYTVEEAYEVADAIERGRLDELEAELGDLLLQVVYHARMAEEMGLFDFERVAGGVARKMADRHPHLFAGGGSVDGAEAQAQAWEAVKSAERAARAAARGERGSALDDVPAGLPALVRAQKLQKRAARVGFDWPDLSGVLAKVEEEVAEVEDALTGRPAPERVRDEIGDLLFAVVNLARKAGVDAEGTLRAGNLKFERRFRAVERRLGLDPEAGVAVDLATLEDAWQAVKAEERRPLDDAPNG